MTAVNSLLRRRSIPDIKGEVVREQTENERRQLQRQKGEPRQLRGTAVASSGESKSLRSQGSARQLKAIASEVE